MGVSVSCMAYMPASKWGEATERESQSIKPMEGDADRSAKVGGAVEKIRDKMYSSFFNPVTNQDLRDVQSTIAGLPNEDASAVVCKLSVSELRHMVEKLIISITRKNRLSLIPWRKNLTASSWRA